MKNSVLILALTVLFLNGCLKSTITRPSSEVEKGSMSVKLDKTNAPQSIAVVNAYLSRSGYDTLKASLNLVSDTSANTTIDSIPVGQWHLTVNAIDANGTILYTGQTDVQIVGGVTTPVTLSLEPVSQGTGTIFITVNWGTTAPNFVDYVSNPVFTPSANPSNPLIVAESKIILDNGIYKMWYLCTYNAGFANIWYAESNDGISWTNKTNLPVLDTGAVGQWDGYALASGDIMKDDTVYKMYYNGYVSQSGPRQVGLATSSDGIHWQKYSEPVLNSNSQADYWIGAGSVLKVNGEYLMYYSSAPLTNYGESTINVATSSDGVIWTKYAGNPALSSSSSWEGTGITYPSVIYDNGQFVMVYANSDETAWGLAYSSDGFHWQKASQNEIFSNAQAKGGLIAVEYPFLLKTNGEYRVYYTSYSSAGQLSIAFARSPNIR